MILLQWLLLHMEMLYSKFHRFWDQSRFLIFFFLSSSKPRLFCSSCTKWSDLWLWMNALNFEKQYSYMALFFFFLSCESWFESSVFCGWQIGRKSNRKSRSLSPLCLLNRHVGSIECIFMLLSMNLNCVTMAKNGQWMAWAHELSARLVTTARKWRL